MSPGKRQKANDDETDETDEQEEGSGKEGKQDEVDMLPIFLLGAVVGGVALWLVETADASRRKTPGVNSVKHAG
jgi:hypothetical protein